MSGGHPSRLGEKVAERRRQLNMTLEGVKAAGGPTGPTVIRTEAGELEDPRPSTLAKFDEALQWQPGSAARVFWEDADPAPRAGELEPAAGTAALSIELVLGLLSAHRRLNDYADAANPDPELHAITAALNEQVSTVVGLFVTDLLERNALEGGAGVVNPLLEYAFGELLSDHPVDHHGQVSEERLYRRWLMGKTADVPAGLARKFRARLRASSVGGSGDDRR
ncbi:MAG: hypothetical protein HOQ24_04020 [Mycobacteriaceae bacterium]|nr:hypothetical protein [Mycobacteriaceae bacterium]